MSLFMSAHESISDVWWDDEKSKGECGCKKMSILILIIIRMFDTIVTLNFAVLLITTAILKLVNSRDTQQFKFYLLLSTLAFFSSKIYKAVKYYQGFRVHNEHQQDAAQPSRTQSNDNSRPCSFK